MDAPFKVDRETGSLSFPDLPLELRPMMPEAEFIAATARLSRDNLGSNQGWQRYSIRQLISGDRRLGIFIIFLNGKLNRVSFAYAHKEESWATWSEQGEAERLKEYHEELAAQLGGQDTFSWGKVGAVLDTKSGGTDIWLNFNTTASEV
jgi:hypothetical protein